MIFKSKDYLVVVDYYLKFFKIVFFEDKVVVILILYFKFIFVGCGILIEFFSDNI